MHAHIIIEKDFENELNRLLDTEEHVDLTITKVLLTGAGGSGKTCTKCTLYNIPSPAEYQSTDLMEPTEKTVHTRDLTLDKAYADSYDWSVVNSKDDVFSMVRATITSKKYAKSGSSHQSLSHSQIQTSKFPTFSHSEAAESFPFPSGGASESPPGTPSKAKEDLLKILNDQMREPSKCVHEVHWIFLTDSGGQSQFHDILPAFLHGYSVILCVVNLSQPLNRQTFDNYFEKGERLGRSKKSHCTVEQILKGIIQSVHCATDLDKSNSPTTASTTNVEGHRATGNDQNDSPTTGSTMNAKVLLIGTHKDLVSSEDVKQINEILNTMFSSFKSKVDWGYHKNGLIFPINGKDQDPDSKKVAEEIRKSIAKTPSIKRPIPISWFLLEEDIISEIGRTPHGIIRKTDCEEIGKKLKLTSKSVEKALEYFHDLNIFFYFPNSKSLSHLVFTRPQVVVTILSAFVKIACRLRSGDIPDAECEKFLKKGLFCDSFVQSNEVATNLFDANVGFDVKEVIELMKITLVVAPIKKIEYFMPCVLQHSPPKDIESELKGSNKAVAPIAIKLSGECIPHGFFCALVCSLLSKTWELHQSEKETTFKNFLRFDIKNMTCSVALVDSFYFIGVHIFGKCRKSACKRILGNLKESVEVVVEKRKYKEEFVEKNLSFPCNCGKKPEHVATLIEEDEGFTLQCQSTKCDNNVTITEKYAIWFNEEQYSKWQETRGIL